MPLEDKSYRSMMSSGQSLSDGDFSSGLADNTLEGGELHIEVVPADQHSVLDPLGRGLCPGGVVKVTGMPVVDADHGVGSEIHPARAITILEHPSTSSASPTRVNGRSIVHPGVKG